MDKLLEAFTAKIDRNLQAKIDRAINDMHNAITAHIGAKSINEMQELGLDYDAIKKRIFESLRDDAHRAAMEKLADQVARY